MTRVGTLVWLGLVLGVVGGATVVGTWLGARPCAEPGPQPRPQAQAIVEEDDTSAALRRLGEDGFTWAITRIERAFGGANYVASAERQRDGGTISVRVVGDTVRDAVTRLVHATAEFKSPIPNAANLPAGQNPR